ncbi:ABC transporter substrate-binding protein [Robbsia sp. KACC 23696]|uniref:ABC transporter substrate-binding protein n=1 Tax=Robbsia sp. KACC 23696 TaxID=3149231 RepID=UPI00325A7CC5
MRLFSLPNHIALGLRRLRPARSSSTSTPSAHGERTVSRRSLQSALCALSVPLTLLTPMVSMTAYAQPSTDAQSAITLGKPATTATASTPTTVTALPAASATPSAPLTVLVSAGGPVHVVQLPDGRLVASDIAPIVQRGELVVAMLGVDSPPFFYQKKGQLVGVEVDLAKELAHSLGVSVRFDRSAMTFDAVVQLLASGHADVAVSKLSQTLARTREIAYSQPYVTLNRALLLNRLRFAAIARKRPLTEVIRSFDGTLGVIAGSSYEEYAKRNFPHATLARYPTWDAVVQAVKNGDVVAAYRDEFEIKRLLKSDPTSALTLRTVTFKDLTDTLAIGVRVDEPTLLAFVNEFLTEHNGRLDVSQLLGALDQ